MSPRIAAMVADRRCTVIDVGARGGLPWHWSAHGRALHVIAFEPDGEEAAQLAGKIEASGARATVLPVAVWDSRGRQMLHLTRSRACSSVYAPRTGFLNDFPESNRFDITERVPLEAVTLDEAVAAVPAPPARFIKLDAQGGALPILQGAERTIATSIGLELETELVANYEGQPVFGDVDRYARDRGFELVDLRPTYWRRSAARAVAGTRGQVVFADALYLIPPRLLAARIAAAPGDEAVHLAASAVLVCEVYRLYDWIVAYDSACTTPGEARELLKSAAAAAARTGGLARMPQFPGRLALGFWLKDLADKLIESSDTWAPAETRLGGRPRLRRRLLGALFGR
jgi:FkbM family methyltransferase